MKCRGERVEKGKKYAEWEKGEREREREGSWFNGLMRPSSSQLFCVRHALTFRSAREPRRLIFHILAITLTLEALADSQLWPFHSDRAFPPQPLHLSVLSSTPLHSTHELASYLNTFPHKICSPHSHVHRENVKCVLHFSNGVFNSLASVKRGDDVDQLRKTE